MKFMDGDGIEIIIYIILAIGGIIANAYRNMAKQKEAQRRQEAGRTDTPEFDPSTLFEYEEEVEEPPHSEVLQETQATIVQEEAVETENPYAQYEGVSVFSETAEELLSDNLSQPGDSFPDDSDIDLISGSQIGMESEQEERGKVDLRQAIIYSEIINPKYV